MISYINLHINYTTQQGWVSGTRVVISHRFLYAQHESGSGKCAYLLNTMGTTILKNAQCLNRLLQQNFHNSKLLLFVSILNFLHLEGVNFYNSNCSPSTMRTDFSMLCLCNSKFCQTVPYKSKFARFIRFKSFILFAGGNLNQKRVQNWEFIDVEECLLNSFSNAKILILVWVG